jgi:regulator of RNase E activity RraA
VVVIPRREAAELVCLYEERLAKEAKNRERLRAGEPGVIYMNFGLS